MCIRAITLAVCGAVLLAPPALGQSSRYSNDWQKTEKKARPAKPATPRLHRLLRELNKITTDAKRDRAGDPRLLSDMRALVRRYSRNWPRVVLRDAFLDRNLTANPRWIVESGNFSVGRRGLIIQRATARAPAPRYAPPPPPPPPEEKRPQGLGEALIGTLFGELTRDRSAAPAPEPAPWQPAPPPSAAISEEGRLRTDVAIPNAFALRVALWSHGNTTGAFEMGVGQGAQASGYRLIYRPAGVPSLELLRVGARGVTVLRSVRKAVRLEDGNRHKLELARDLVGEMTVAVDGKVRLRLFDSTFRDRFDSVVLRIRDGDYTVRGVVVAGTP